VNDSGETCRKSWRNRMTFSTRKTGHSSLRFLQGERHHAPIQRDFYCRAAAGQAALWSQTPSHSADAAKISANLVSFYEVPLACPAARGLGCGSARNRCSRRWRRSAVSRKPGSTIREPHSHRVEEDAKSDSRAAGIQSLRTIAASPCTR